MKQGARSVGTRGRSQAAARVACGLRTVWTWALLVALLGGGCQPQPQPPASTPPNAQASYRPGYSFSCWLNGWRKTPRDQSPEVLAIQARGYSFTLNLGDFSQAAFSAEVPHPVGYADALETGIDSLCRLPPADLRLAV
jgi:hypothetical protein